MEKVAVRRVNEWDGPSMLKIYAPYTEGLEAFEGEPESFALGDAMRSIRRLTWRPPRSSLISFARRRPARAPDFFDGEPMTMSPLIWSSYLFV